MKQTFLLLSAALSLFAASCNDTKDATKSGAAMTVNSAAASATYTVNTDSSKVTWIGSKPVGDSHTGNINIKSGVINTDEGGVINGGNFVLDMTSIMPTDMDEKGNTKLSTHLKSPDFFDADQFKEAKFEVVSVVPATDADKAKIPATTHIITGNLTMRGTTKSVKVPTMVSVKDGQLLSRSEVVIDRTEWGVNYNSEMGIKDKFISKEVALTIVLHGTKN